MALPKGFGGKAANVAEQMLVWGVLQQIIGAMLFPLINEIQRGVNEVSQTVPLSPADLADMVNRHFVAMNDAIAYAKQSGIAPSDFARLVDNAGDAPGPDQLAVALRRGLIPESGTGPDSTSFEQGIAEGRLKDKWTPMMRALSVEWPSPTDALDALLEGQVDDATGRELYEKFGGAPEYFQMLFDTRGSAPTPVELSEMANRGVIPWDGQGAQVTSYHQGFLEGPWRNKWEEPYRKLAEYRPPLRTITAMVRNGSIDDATALQWYKDLGATDAMAQAQLRDAHATKTQAEKNLAVSTVLSLYQERFIDAGTATNMLEELRYTAQDAAWMLQLEDFKVVQSTLNGAVSRLKALYIARKIDAGTARNALNSMLLPPSHIDQLLQTWDLERQASVKILTPAEIADAVYYQIIDVATGIQELVDLGYTERDAWIRISIRLKGPATQTMPPA